MLANRDKTVVARYPLHTLQAIVSFSYAGASPALMGKCAEAGIGLAFCSPRGRFLARTCGESSGNVLLRREQYRIADYPLSTGNQEQHEIINHGNRTGYSDCVAAGQYRLRIGNYL